MSQFVTCEVEGYALCVPIAAVQEVHRIRTITPMQRAPRHVAGLLNLRGRVVTMIDLGVRMGMADSAQAGRAQNIVLKRADELSKAGIAVHSGDMDSHDEVLGLAVDHVGDVIDVPDSAIGEVPANIEGAHAEYLNGVVRIESRVLSIVNIGRVMTPDNTGLGN